MSSRETGKAEIGELSAIRLKDLLLHKVSLVKALSQEHNRSIYVPFH